MKIECAAVSVELFIVKSTPDGHAAIRLSDPSNSPEHDSAVRNRAHEMALASDSAVARLQLIWTA